MKTASLARFAALLVLAIAMVASAPVAHAQGPVACTVLEIDASTGDPPSIDPELKGLEKKLKKPPFSSWNTFKRLGSQSLNLEPMKPSALTLVNGKGELILRDVTTGGTKKPRISLGITIDDKDGKRWMDSKVHVDAGDWLMMARSTKGNRGQVVAVTCKL